MPGRCVLQFNALSNLFFLLGEYDILKTLLGEMEPRDRSSTVRDWATGGQVCHKSIVIPVAAIVAGQRH